MFSTIVFLVAMSLSFTITDGAAQRYADYHPEAVASQERYREWVSTQPPTSNTQPSRWEALGEP